MKYVQILLAILIIGCATEKTTEHNLETAKSSELENANNQKADEFWL